MVIEGEVDFSRESDDIVDILREESKKEGNEGLTEVLSEAADELELANEELEEVEQILGKALGFPYIGDHSTGRIKTPNFPNYKDIAILAAQEIDALRQAIKLHMEFGDDEKLYRALTRDKGTYGEDVRE